MVGSGVVELTENIDEESIGPLPEMMFAEGEEPVGVRVLTYQSSRAINTILEALDEEEIQWLRQTSFGKIVDLADKPGFSGRFARYLLSRQLKVEKKHEAWFRFAGQPIRFSLREFAIVTGLPCGEFPKKSKLKRKKNIQEKPYWPEIFGRVEDMRVSTALKMLRKKTVTDRDIRMKLACLALVSSVLLSTNLRMKMLKEHAEMLVDMDFFTFPWGRLAFDMLMTSIKKRDEISLSQNTIALKGFALALQLVIIEAVPALTEVVQESCSSSESDSDDEDLDRRSSTTKKQTLSPSHAREVDRKAEALVTSIIPQDPARPVEDSLVSWSDDVVDVRVDNLVRLIARNHQIQKHIIRGGLTKADVEKMRDMVKEIGKRKQQTKKQVEGIQDIDEAKIKSVVHSILTPEIHRLDGNVAAAVTTIKEVSTNALAYQASVVATVDGLLKSFKREILSYVEKGNLQSPGEAQNQTPMSGGVENRAVSPKRTPVIRNANDVIVDNVLENLSHYSTPEASGKRCPGSEAHSYRQVSQEPGGSHSHKSNPLNETRSDQSDKPTSARRLSLNVSQGSASHSPLQLRKVGSVVRQDGGSSHQHSVSAQSQNQGSTAANAVHVLLDLPLPSFSLGLTQELLTVRPQEDEDIGDNQKDLVAEDNVQEMGDVEENLICRKSKRTRHVPPLLISDYHCGNSILNRSREVQPGGPTCYDPSEIREKYIRLKLLLKNDCVINVAGLSVSGKDLVDIGERNRFLPGRVVDILTRLVTSNFNNYEMGRGDTSKVFLDSRVQVLLSRNYPKFKKLKNKEAYVFTKAMVDCVRRCYDRYDVVPRFYIPFNVYHKHWIGLCVDILSSKIIVLDCNTGIIVDDALEKELLPISEMFPYLLKHVGHAIQPCGNQFQVERLQCVPENTNPAESALTACLLIQNHALFGVHSIASVTPSTIPGEAQKAAIMVYEFHRKL